MTPDDFATSTQLFNLFPTPLLVSAAPNAEALNNELRAVILKRKATHPSVNKSNRHGWQSSDDFFSWAGAAGHTLRDHAISLVDHVTRTFQPGAAQLQPFGGAWQINGWANVNHKGARNEMHSHPGCFWSAVYYVDTGDAGGETPGAQLELHDPRGTAPIMYGPTLRINLKGCIAAGATETYAPMAGSMVLFPSWLLHSVAEQTANGERISIAFNFSI